MRISSDAVRPRMSLARAVSCTPGSCTTTRSAPCCWMIGSATPSSLTRLRRIWMFCCDRAVLDALLRLGLQARDEPQVAAGSGVGVAQREVGIVLLDGGARLDALRLVLEAHHDVAAVARDAAVLDLLAAQQRADVGRVAVAGLVERGLHVDLQQEMHAAAQVEARGTSAARRSTSATAATTTAGSARRCSCRRASPAARPSPSAACRCRRSGP